MQVQHETLRQMIYSKKEGKSFGEEADEILRQCVGGEIDPQQAIKKLRECEALL